MDEKEFDYMNVIPLVDVMLVLLTIVLTTSTFIATGAIPIDLPKVTSRQATAEPAQLMIEIDQQGIIFWKSRPISLRQLQTALRQVNPSVPLMIRADQTVKLQKFVDVIDIIKQLKFCHVMLQTEEKQ
ncbi:biopolymer transporter ExbD [bacterium]|nr:biopolymer transporter ExbD [bacterium]